ncbi:MAG: 16S rRNA (cytidine(1402)-2'-O)-methyltransferase [Alphaproteobacteria bacterium]|nr:16S rRNA (cytidine(1402)-2'-O)-methyltransferase [Alphaproteobacteria bacterium]
MLYLVATPIGNLKDISLRAIEILNEVDMIVCEDTRVSLKLLSHYGISKPLLPYHDHNANHIRPRILSFLGDGKNIAYITDGGMPLISDPGFKLILACQRKNYPYTVIPGPSAPLMALCLSGLSPDRFFFCGFLPPKSAARKAVLETIKSIQATLLFFESPKRLLPFLKDAQEVLGDREGAICREMTKLFEDVQKGALSKLKEYYETYPPRGEIVVVVEGASSSSSFSEKDLETYLKKALETYSLKEAVNLVATAMGLSKREIYQRALQLKSERKSLS